MKKGNLLLIGGLGLAAYFLLTKGKSMFAAKGEEAESTEGTGEAEATSTETTETITAPAGKVTDAIATAKQIVSTVKDAVIDVQTPTGTVTVARKTVLAERRRKKLAAKKEKKGKKITKKYKKKKKLSAKDKAAIQQAKKDFLIKSMLPA